MDKKYFIDSQYRSEGVQVNLFEEILKKIKTKNPCMIELGCGEAVYSELFNNFFNNNCTNICTDILPRQIEKAKLICKNCKFYHGYSGKKTHLQEIKENNFDAKKIFLINLFQENSIEKLNVIHMDIQGDEIYVLEEIEMENLFSKIQFYFVSTHGVDIHTKCLEKIKNYEIEINFLYDSPTSGGYGDGLIVFENLNF